MKLPPTFPLGMFGASTGALVSVVGDARELSLACFGGHSVNRMFGASTGAHYMCGVRMVCCMRGRSTIAPISHIFLSSNGKGTILGGLRMALCAM